MQKLKNSFTNKAFTLAEVLIVLGIIGVIAAMTIPTLIANNQDRAALVSMKKSVSVLDSAFKLAQVNEDKIENWYTGSNASDAALKVIEIMKKYLNTTQTCSGSDSSCFPTIGSINIGTAPSISVNNSSIARFSLSDGSSIALQPSLSAGISQFTIYVDVNGLKQPNRYGWDVFQFMLYTETKALSSNVKPLILIPYGATSKTGALSSTNCDRNTTSTNSNEAGAYCSAWAYIIGNRDYLRCDDLNWQTKLTCD